MKKRYTHIFFDLDNTLWDFKTNSRLSMEATYTQMNVAKSGVEFIEFFKNYSEINDKLWTAYRKKEIKKKELTQLRFQQTFDLLNISGVDAQEMNDHYLNVMPKQKVLMDGAFDILEYLKQKKYKLYIITNGFREVQHNKLQSSGLANYFEKVFISEELKCPKPGKIIFEHAIKSANAKKANGLMIGDDWEVDVLGAQNFGIDSVHFSNGKQITEINKKEVANSNNTIYSIAKLEELKELL